MLHAMWLGEITIRQPHVNNYKAQRSQVKFDDTQQGSSSLIESARKSRGIVGTVFLYCSSKFCRLAIKSGFLTRSVAGFVPSPA